MSEVFPKANGKTASIHDLMIVDSNGFPQLYGYSVSGQCYVVEDSEKDIAYHWDVNGINVYDFDDETISFAKISDIPDEVWLSLKQNMSKITFCMTVDK